jgi:hypothetical protein
MRIKLTKPYMGHAAGSIIEMPTHRAEALIRDRFAQKVPGRKTKSPSNIKG